MVFKTIETGHYKIHKVRFAKKVDLNIGNLKVLPTCHLIDFTGASWDPRCPMRCIRKT